MHIYKYIYTKISHTSTYTGSTQPSVLRTYSVWLHHVFNQFLVASAFFITTWGKKLKHALGQSIRTGIDR